MAIVPFLTVNIAPSANPVKVPAIAELPSLSTISKELPTAGKAVDVTLRLPPRETIPVVLTTLPTSLTPETVAICKVSLPVDASVKLPLTRSEEHTSELQSRGH